MKNSLVLVSDLPRALALLHPIAANVKDDE